MLKYIILICALITLNDLVAQKKDYSGFLGRKILFQASVNAFNPLLSNSFGDGFEFSRPKQYKASGSKLVTTRDYIDWQAKVGLTYYKRRNFGLGVDIGYLNFQLSPFEEASVRYSFYNDEYNYQDRVTLYGKIENLNCNYLSIMPKIEFSSRSGLLPIGIAHSIGIGYNMISIEKNDYRYEIDDTYSEDPDLNAFVQDRFRNKLIDYRKLHAVTLMYGLTMRLPITDRLLFVYNLSYSLNYTFGKTDEEDVFGYYPYTVNIEPSSEYVLSYNKLVALMRKELLYNVLKFGVGFAYTIK